MKGVPLSQVTRDRISASVKIARAGGGNAGAAIERPDPSPTRGQVNGCPVCGQPRRFVSDLLTGVVSTVCDTCDRNAARAQLRAQYEDGAIKYLAAKAGRSIDELRKYLRLKTAKPPRLCRCGAALLRGRRLCARCRAERLNARRVHGFHPRADRTYAKKPCPRCGALFTPTGPNARYCPASHAP